MSGRVAGSKGFTRVTFTENGGQVTITTDNGSKETVPYTSTLVNTKAPNYYHVSIPAAIDYGIDAHFKLANWGAGETFYVVISPTEYHFDDVAEKIRKDSIATGLLSAEGTLQAFGETTNPMKKVGLTALAVIRRMIRAINEDQSGFSVEATYDEDGAEPLERLYDIEPAFVEGLDDPVVDDEAPVGFNA